MAKMCDVCGQKLGFLANKWQLKDGIVCDAHLGIDPVEMSAGGLTEFGTKLENLKNITLDDVKIAIDGDSAKLEEIYNAVYAGITSKNEASKNESPTSNNHTKAKNKIKQKERKNNMLMVNTESIPGKNIELIGIVKGSSVETSFSGFFGLAGTGVGDAILEMTYSNVNEQMIEEAATLKADAIVNVRYSMAGLTSDDEPAMIFFATGTAVKYLE